MHPIDWDSVLHMAHDDPEWLSFPLVERGRATSLYAPSGEGKSLVALEVAAGIASGRNALGYATRPANVIVWDMENDEQLISQRVRSMEFAAPDLVDRLFYFSYPDCGGLDTDDGAEALINAASKYDAALVVIDTYATSVDGRENSADTARAFARKVTGPLKAQGVASLRLDHTGKVASLGERGSSAKRGDVDYAWHQVKVGPNEFELRNTKNRPGSAPLEVHFTRHDEPLRHEITNIVGFDPIERIVLDLDRHGLPLDVSERNAKAQGITGKSTYLRAAIKLRRERAARR